MIPGPSSGKGVLESVINGGDYQNGRAVPFLTSEAKVSTAFPVQEKVQTESKRNVPTMDEPRHSKQHFKMAVSMMTSACSICSKTSQTGVGGICKGCWNQFQAKGVRIGNLNEFNEFTQSVKNSVSKIEKANPEGSSSSYSQGVSINSLRELIPSVFFKEKDKSLANRSTAVDNGVRESLSGLKKNESFSKKENDTPYKTSKAIENTKGIDNASSTNKGYNAKSQYMSRSRTFANVESRKQLESSVDKPKENIDTDPKARYKVTRAKTQVNMKGNLDRKQPDHSSSSVSENNDKSNAYGKQRYEPSTVNESSKLTQLKSDSSVNRDKRYDSKYGHNVKQNLSQRKLYSKGNNRYERYEANIKLGTRTIKANALRQMAGNNQSSSDEDDDSETKSKKDNYKLNDLMVSSQTNSMSSIKNVRGKVASKKNEKESNFDSSKSKCAFAVQNKYSAYAKLNSDKPDNDKKSSDIQKPTDSIYFPEQGLVAKLSSFISSIKNPNENQIPQIKQNGEDVYYSGTGSSSTFKNDTNLAVAGSTKTNASSFYYDTKPIPSSNTAPDDYTMYKQARETSSIMPSIESRESETIGRLQGIDSQSCYYTNHNDTNGTSSLSAMTMPYEKEQLAIAATPTKANNISEDTSYTGGFLGKSYNFQTSEEPSQAISNIKSIDFGDKKNDAGSYAPGEFYSRPGNDSKIDPYTGDPYTGSKYEVTGINQQINKSIFHRPEAETTEPKAPLMPTILPSEPSSFDDGPSNKSKRMFRRRNKAMDEMVETSLASAGEFFSKAIVSFKGPFGNNFSNNSNKIWYGDQCAIANSAHDDMSFEKPNYTDWDQEMKPVFIKPIPKSKKSPPVLDFLKYEKEREVYEPKEEKSDDKWYAGTDEEFHGPVNTTWDGRDWTKKGNVQRAQRPQESDEEDDTFTDFQNCKACRICPTNNNASSLVCNYNNNYPDYDKYDKPVVVQKPVKQPEAMGNDNDYAPMLYADPDDRYVGRKPVPSPVSFRPPSPPTTPQYSSYFYMAESSSIDDEPEYAGYEPRRPVEVRKEPSPPAVPKIIKVGSIMVRNNVENDFDYAENVNRDLGDDSFGAMGFNERSRELNEMGRGMAHGFPQATASTLMTDTGNLKQFIDVQQAIRRDSAAKTSSDGPCGAYQPSARTAPFQMREHHMDHGEPARRSTKNKTVTRTTSVTSDAVSRKNSLEADTLRMPSMPKHLQSSTNTSVKKQSTPRKCKSTTVDPKRTQPGSQTSKPRQTNYTSHMKRRDRSRNKDGKQQKEDGWLSAVYKPLKYFSKKE